MGQWFRLHASTAGVTAQSLVWELRTTSHAAQPTITTQPPENTWILETKAGSAHLQRGGLVGAGVGGLGELRLHHLVSSCGKWDDNINDNSNNRGAWKDVRRCLRCA